MIGTREVGARKGNRQKRKEPRKDAKAIVLNFNCPYAYSHRFLEFVALIALAFGRAPEILDGGGGTNAFAPVRGSLRFLRLILSPKPPTPGRPPL
jgi:hypothetical protein